uniref:F-box domain-containing protein n=1 Tax=Medicago truncatula TaxID=3880 RepID=I3T662_MEDTR|nr:unknown [Medicago truncatula]
MAQPNEREEQNDTVSSKRQQLITSTESPLPSPTFDLIAEILSRLPVKLLLQLQCLGKFWKSLISDPKFAKKHLQSWRHHLMVSSTNELQEFLLFDSPIASILSTFRVTQTDTTQSPRCLRKPCIQKTIEYVLLPWLRSFH